MARLQLTVLILLSLGGAVCSQPSPCAQTSGEEESGTFSRPTGAPSFAVFDIPTNASKYPYNHAASMAELPGGDLLAVWGAGSQELARDTVIVASRKPKSADRWSAPIVVADKPDAPDANPVLFVDPSGTVWLFHVEMFGDSFCLGRVMVQRSTDDGLTWSSTRQALDAICTMIKNKPIVTRTGRWVLPAYQQGVYQSQFWLSDDRGTTWQSTASLFTFGNNNLQPAVAELSSGSLYALMRNGGDGGFTWEGRSTDCGVTWRLSERPDLPNPNSGLDMTRLADGRLVLIYNDNPRDRTPLVAALSEDGGKAWSVPRIIESGDPQLSYPSVIQSRDGMIHVVYSHRLQFIRHAAFNLAWLLQMSGS